MLGSPGNGVDNACRFCPTRERNLEFRQISSRALQAKADGFAWPAVPMLPPTVWL
jgi:hypothetical protein